MDIIKYLNRIGISEILPPNLNSLKKLQKKHLYNIPFENLDIHYGNKIELNEQLFYDKIVNNNRGGFCYELNGLFYELLIALKYDVRRVSAKVYGKNKQYGKEYDHLALLVKIETREYLSDVGFGEFIVEPLAFEMETKQKDKNGIFYFDKYDYEYYRVNKVENKENIPLYIFKDVKRDLKEFSGMCNFHQSSNESHFTQKKVITLPTKNGRITLNNDKLKITENGIQEEINIRNEIEFDKKLWDYFKIKI